MDFTGRHPFDESEKNKIKRLFGEDKWILSYGDQDKWVSVWEKSTNQPILFIRCLPDEYYDVQIGPEYYRCDQFDGVKELLRDKNIIT